MLGAPVQTLSRTIEEQFGAGPPWRGESHE